MWLCGTLTGCITVLFMTFALAECYPLMFPRTFQQGGSFTNQQLSNSPFQVGIPQIPAKINDPVPQQRQKMVSVYCHDEAIEIVINADLLASGLPVYADELWLGPESLLNNVSAASCGAVQTGSSEFTILAYLKDCGTNLSVTVDYLVYSNVFVYSPLPSPGGVLHMDGAVISVQCQYQRWYNVDSAALAPTWIPFASTVAATDYLDFSLQLMSDDWQYERGSNVYFFGDVMHLQASVTLANHMPLLLFIDWCVATPTLNMNPSEVQYSFLGSHGCLADSRSMYSHSKFLQRSQGNKLNLLLDAFRFYNLTSNLVYFQCYLKAIPAAYSVSTLNRACSFFEGRWQSVDGNDEVCNTCEPSNQAADVPQPMKPFPITLDPPVKQMILTPPMKQPHLGYKAGSADFVRVRPGQSLEPFRDLILSKQYAYGGLSKRGTDSDKEWRTVATLGPVFLIPEHKATTQSTELLKFAVDEVFSASFTEEPEFLFNSTETSPVTDELAFEPAKKFRSFSPLDKGLLFNASDLYSSEEGSGFE